MFNEDEDWSDEQEGQILSETVFQHNPKSERRTHLKSSVGKKSLLRTLETLGSTPDWRSSDQEQDSDAAAPSQPSKHRKKRRKRRKHGEQEGGDISQTLKDTQTPQLKKKKKRGGKPEGASKANRISAEETDGEKVLDPPQESVNNQQSPDKLSRQQWRNKTKNKKRCKNKFLQNKPESDATGAKTADEQEPALEIKIGLFNDNSENMSQTENRKPNREKQSTEKRKITEQEVDGFTKGTRHKQAKLEKIKSGKSAKGSAEGSAEGLKHKADELQVGATDQQQQRQKFNCSKQQSLKREKLQKILLRQDKDDAKVSEERTDPPAVPKEAGQSRADSLRSRMEQRLEAARFRYINEQLYSTSSVEARTMFRQDPQAFWVYHKGYTAQVQRWPANPVDAIISYIHKKPPSLVVADFGCGDCKIARSVKNKVHSFDLAAACDLVTVCDMARVPLGDESVDIAVFCLSLMGTNLSDFLAEANRVLRMRGILKIAEVASRFEDVQNFISALGSLGFKMTAKDTENSHFFSFDFAKTGNASINKKKFRLQLKPCVYKKR